MTDISKLVADVYQPFMTTMPELVVANAFAGLPPQRWDVNDLDTPIEELEIASHAISGLAAGAVKPGVGETRASTRVTLPVSDGTTTEKAEATITLYGPGDVLGLEPGMILRRHPAPGTRNAEVTDLAHIEFDRPELPWAFSTDPQTRKPWLALIVVPLNQTTLDFSPGLPPTLNVPGTELPDLADSTHWAHAQTVVSSTDLSTRLSPSHAEVNLSRLVSPRVLENNTTYLAALVPTTEAGRQRGLGGSGGSLHPAWFTGSSEDIRLPVYDHWEFTTGPAGDFASLALKLKGVPAPWQVGRRRIDTSVPGKPMTETLLQGALGSKQLLKCALFSPADPPAPDDEWPEQMTEDLRTQLNRPALLDGRTLPSLPIVGPRIYGNKHRGESMISTSISQSDWFGQLNLSPSNRVIAGLGTRVVQRDQEQMMQAAWAQIGEVLKANTAISKAELGAELADRFHNRMGDFFPGHFTQVATPMAHRLPMGQGQTLAGLINASSTPLMAGSGAFRRVTRGNGPIMRNVRNGEQLAGSIVGTSTQLRDFTHTYMNPDGVSALSKASLSILDQTQAAAALDLSPQVFLKTFLRNTSRTQGGLFPQLRNQRTWKPISDSFDPGAELAKSWLAAMSAEAPNAMVEKIRKQQLGPLAAALAISPSPAMTAIRTEMKDIAVLLNDVVVTTKPQSDFVVKTDVFPEVLNKRILKGVEKIGKIPRIKDLLKDARNNNPRITTERINLDKINTGQTGRVDTGRVDTGRVDTGRVDTGRVDTGKVGSGLDKRIPIDAIDEVLERHAKLAPSHYMKIFETIGKVSLEDMRAVIPELLDPGAISAIPVMPRRAPAQVDALLAAVDPHVTIPAAISARFNPPHRADIGTPPLLQKKMVAPRIDRPMFRALEAYDRNWLIPGMEHLPNEDFVTVLSMNKQFIEAFFVGLSDEFGRELLWRGFPTDQRGTYFRRFWTKEKDDLNTQIHQFSETDLGSHVGVGSSGVDAGSERAVIVIKSDLVRRYPDVVVTLALREGEDAQTEFSPATQLFATHLDPDYTLIGVDISISDLKTDDWWLVISEHPEATRFSVSGETTNGKFVSPPASPVNSAEWASRYIHQPIQVAFAAENILS